jgi:enoyl-CoA hydratase/carnithine racemase
MDLVLTGRPWTAQEAEAAGLVARIYPADKLVEESIKAAQEIASYSLPSVLMAKEAINKCKSLCAYGKQCSYFKLSVVQPLKCLSRLALILSAVSFTRSSRRYTFFIERVYSRILTNLSFDAQQKDQKEGMTAFAEKRAANFKNE